MAFRYFIVCFLLVACAQVKSLEGGPRDESAPVPFGVVPKNGAVNFTGQAIAITFDEYVKLNNPNQTISIVPNDVKIRSELKDKTLMLYWTEPLRENTTYSIFFNKTIKDITEANDSILQYVFSTGPFIDSLEYSTFVIDAKDGKPKKNVVVGLFDHPDSLKPIYFGLTDANGKATLNYLKEGEYYVRAFDDASKKGQITKNDAVAFKDEVIVPEKGKVDSAAIKLFSPLSKPKIRTFQYIAPGAFVVGMNRSLENAVFSINDTIISQNNVKFYEKDSVLLFVRPQENASQKLLVQTDEWQDSTKLRITKTKTKVFSIHTEKPDYFSGKPIVLTIDDQISAVDTSKVTIQSVEDSLWIKNYTYEINGNEWLIQLPEFKGDRIKITIKSEAITASEGWKQEEFSKQFTKRLDKEFGVLDVKIHQYVEPIILELLYNNTVARRENVSGDKTIRFEQLEPGDYTFRIIVDSNQNGQWDTGNFEERLQPEEIHLYSKPTKVRANWDVEVELEPLEK
ncbi:MAG: Ig-like domain-containing protein [Crocinitomicaceae bacterium]|nr:Ig-like domain-containing protein [Crocinitomicaceae bacterium]